MIQIEIFVIITLVYFYKNNKQIKGVNMTKLRNMLLALIFSVATTPLLASGDDFAGPYIAVIGSSNGVELDGSSTDSNSEIHKGKGGMFALAGGAEIGYTLPLGGNGFVTLSGSIMPGDAEITLDEGASNSTNNADVKIELGDIMTVSLSPGVAISESSAIYVKVGYTEADLSVTGDATKISSMDGTTVAIGTRSLMPSGMFIQTEAGMVDYDNIKLTGLGNYIATTNSVTADPTVAYGSLTIGYKF